MGGRYYDYPYRAKLWEAAVRIATMCHHQLPASARVVYKIADREVCRDCWQAYNDEADAIVSGGRDGA